MQTLSLNENTRHFSASRLTSCEILLLSPSHIVIYHHQNLNPAFLYSLMGHTRTVINTRSLSCPRLALSENALPQVDLTFHVHGSCLRNEDGAFQAGCAITDQHTLLEYRTLPNVKPAQETKLITLTQACIKAKGIKVNIYVDGCCAFRVYMIWVHYRNTEDS